MLLQTARAQVTSTDEKAVKCLRHLFDSGSQMPYINRKVRDELQLPTLGNRELVIKTFGNAKDTKNLDIVKFTVKSQNKNLSILCHGFSFRYLLSSG